MHRCENLERSSAKKTRAEHIMELDNDAVQRQFIKGNTGKIDLGERVHKNVYSQQRAGSVGYNSFTKNQKASTKVCTQNFLGMGSKDLRDNRKSKRVYPGGFRYHDIGNYDTHEDNGYSILVKKRWKYTKNVELPIWESLYRDGIRRHGQRGNSVKQHAHHF